jgi:hypothetical protein
VLTPLLALNLLFRVVPALRPLVQLDDLAIPDDAYLSLEIARNIAHGLGPLHGLAPTNGFQPLYVFLLAPVFAVFPHDLFTPIRVALLLLAACDTIGLYFLVRILERNCESRAAPMLVAASWIVSPYAILSSLNGIETSLAVCLLLAALDRFDRLRHALPGSIPVRRWIAPGILLGLATLARIDAWLLLPGLAWALTRAQRRTRAPLRAALVPLCVMAGVALLVYGPWLAYSQHYTGEWFPISGRAVRFSTVTSWDYAPTWRNTYLAMLERAAWVIATNNPVHLGLIAVLGAALAARRGVAGLRAAAGRLAALEPLAIFVLLILAAYIGVIFGPWHFQRYLFPVALLLALASGLLADVAIHEFRGAPARRWLVPGLAALIVAGSLGHPDFGRLFSPRAPAPWGFMRIGLWARERFAAGTRIGGPQSGALGYFADRCVVVNLDGVVNRQCYDALRERRLMDYIRASGIRFLLWQGDIYYLVRRSASYRPGDIKFLGRVQDIRTCNDRWDLYRVRATRDSLVRGPGSIGLTPASLEPASSPRSIAEMAGTAGVPPADAGR